jgi:hypothetical protein
MTAKEILAIQRLQPFTGLRIHVSDGETYEIKRPEMMVVTRTLVVLAQPPLTDGVPERTVYCDPVHITRIEPVDGH